MKELPGPELDALVAEKVMGELLVVFCKYCSKPTKRNAEGNCRHCRYVHPYFVLPPYSTDIAAAWEVVKKFDGCELRWNTYHRQKPWRCDLTRYKPEGFGQSEATTPEHAICLAALKAVERQ